jgi:hypothetical protein
MSISFLIKLAHTQLVIVLLQLPSGFMVASWSNDVSRPCLAHGRIVADSR